MHSCKILLLLAALAWRAEARAVAPEDVQGVRTVQPEPAEAREDVFYDHEPRYEYSYRIQDEETGDVKGQTEERRGDSVQGSYSVVDPDGTLRVVKYTADGEHGFNAVVSLTPGYSKPITPFRSAQQRVGAQPKVAVAHQHVDVPVPVQHHVIAPTSQQIADDRRVMVQHPTYQSGVFTHQHVIQPPLALGMHQDVHHLIPHNAYQLHHIHQVPGSGVHHQSLPLAQEVRVKEQEQDALKTHELTRPVLPQAQQQQQQQLQQDNQNVIGTLTQEQGMNFGLQQILFHPGLQHSLHKGVQEGVFPHGVLQQGVGQGPQQDFQQYESIQQGIQQNIGQNLQQVQSLGNPQQGVQQTSQQDPQDGAPQQDLQQYESIQQSSQQNIGQNLQQVQSLGSLEQGVQQTTQQDPQDGAPQQALQQQRKQESTPVLTEQQENNKQQQSPVDPTSLPEVYLRNSVQKTVVEIPQQQLRSLESEDQAALQVHHEVQQVYPRVQQVHQVHHEVQQVQHTVPHQRTLAVYRTTATSAGTQGTNFISFNSPYAQYTIS